jgi:hypothetical protein
MFTRIVHVFIPRERRERVAEILQSDAIFRAFAVYNRKERGERSVQNIINIRKILPFRLRSMAPLFRILRLF